MSVAVRRVESADPATAERLAALRRAAYAVEARWLGVTDFPPARASAESVAREQAITFVAHESGEWLGALALEPWPGGAYLVSSLVVEPAQHRRGVARGLLAHVVAAFGDRELVVSTGVANTAALALYRGFGFVEGTRRIVGAEPIEVVQLRRTPGGTAAAAGAADPH
ncbi:MAG: GNAT family N-acetyltransferase [Candidatus Eisenbacteria bacterium]